MLFNVVWMHFLLGVEERVGTKKTHVTGILMSAAQTSIGINILHAYGHTH